MSRFARSFSGCLALGLLVAVSADGQEQTYEATCEELSGNLQSDEQTCEGFRFSDGVNDIAGGLARINGFEFDDNLVRITGGVRLTFGTTEVAADEALLRFEGDELVQGELSGDPVEMSDYIAERDATVGGTAQSITYDSRGGTVSLNGRSTLAVGENTFMGCDWVYNFIEQTYEAGTSDDCSGVQFRLTPPPEESGDPEIQPPAP
jgi:lipopolysaccharide transport protein LptA